jgi:two-component system NarL family response regulator
LNAKINVFLLAGNRLFREALARILRTKNDLNVAGSECCSPQAVQEVERSNSDVLLIDPMIGESCDIPLVQRIAYASPTAKTILIDMLEDEAIFLKAVHAGAVGYLLQQASALDVVAAVRSVHQGEAVCPPRLCMALFKHLSGVGSRLVGGNGRHGKTPARLTRREHQLIPLISQGLTNKEIAAQLNLSEQTVKNHIHRILQRMGACDRFAAVEMARDRSLLVQA